MSQIQVIVHGADGSHIEGINVTILSKSDSSLITNTVTDDDGRFSFEDSSLVLPCLLILKFTKGNVYNHTTSRVFVDNAEPYIIAIPQTQSYQKIPLLLKHTKERLHRNSERVKQYKNYVDLFDLRFREESTYPENKALKKEIQQIVDEYEKLVQKLKRTEDAIQNQDFDVQNTIKVLENIRTREKDLKFLISSIKLKDPPIFIPYVDVDTCICIKTDGRSSIELDLIFKEKSQRQEEIRVYLYWIDEKTENETLLLLKREGGKHSHIQQNTLVGMHKIGFKLVSKNAFQFKKKGEFKVFFKYGKGFQNRYIFKLKNIEQCPKI